MFCIWINFKLSTFFAVLLYCYVKLLICENLLTDLHIKTGYLFYQLAFLKHLNRWDLFDKFSFLFSLPFCSLSNNYIHKLITTALHWLLFITSEETQTETAGCHWTGALLRFCCSAILLAVLRMLFFRVFNFENRNFVSTWKKKGKPLPLLLI